MNAPDNDRLVNRAVEELRRLPALDRAAIDRVVRAAAAARVSSAEETVVVAPPRTRSVRLWGAIGLAAAAGIIGFVARGQWTGRTEPAAPAVATTAVAAPPANGATRFAGVDPSAAVPVQEPFVFESATAKRVSVVGDFNKWNRAATPMVRSANGVWSVIVPILPGRHVYAFMVDDSVLTLDPRAPKVRDPDLGTDGSVVMVGKP